MLVPVSGIVCSLQSSGPFSIPVHYCAHGEAFKGHIQCGGGSRPLFCDCVPAALWCCGSCGGSSKLAHLILSCSTQLCTGPSRRPILGITPRQRQGRKVLREARDQSDHQERIEGVRFQLRLSGREHPRVRPTCESARSSSYEAAAASGFDESSGQ